METPGFERILIFRVCMLFRLFDGGERAARRDHGQILQYPSDGKGRHFGRAQDDDHRRKLPKGDLAWRSLSSPRPRRKRPTLPSFPPFMRCFLPRSPKISPVFSFSMLRGSLPARRSRSYRAIGAAILPSNVHDTIFSTRSLPASWKRTAFLPTSLHALWRAASLLRASRRRSSTSMRAGAGKRDSTNCSAGSLPPSLPRKRKQEKRLSQILEKRRQCEGMEEDKIKGELLTANLYRLKQGDALLRA